MHGEVRFTALGSLPVERQPHPIVATPRRGEVIIGFRDGGYAILDLEAGTRRELRLPPGFRLYAMDARRRCYGTMDDGRMLVRLGADLRIDFRRELPGYRDLALGVEGSVLTYFYQAHRCELFNAEGRFLRAYEKGVATPYSAAVDPSGDIWLGDASFCDVVRLVPGSEYGAESIDPREDMTEENLFCYTYRLDFDRSGNMWAFNGQGDRGMTVLSPDKGSYIRFPGHHEWWASMPAVSPWHDVLFVYAPDGRIEARAFELLSWRPVTSRIGYVNETPGL